MQDWNDLRFFLAVAEQGSTLAASVVRGTSQSTVFRRISALEQYLGLKLFERRASGYTLTAAGDALLPLAKSIESQVSRFGEAAAREERQHTTIVRFSAPEVAIEYLLPTIAAYRAHHPETQVELVASDRRLSLADGEADVALRTSPTASEAGVFGRRVAYERPLLVASRSYADQHPLPTADEDVKNHDFISLTSNLAVFLREWFDENVPRHRILLQPNSMSSGLTAVRAGLGISVLPQFLCDREPELVAAPLRLPISTVEMWVVSHERLRGHAASRALMEAIGRYIVSTTVER